MTAPVKVELGEGSPTRYLPLSEVAPLVRRVVSVVPDTYIELGLRSFNKGTRPSTPHGNEEDRPLLDQREGAAR